MRLSLWSALMIHHTLNTGHAGPEQVAVGSRVFWQLTVPEHRRDDRRPHEKVAYLAGRTARPMRQHSAFSIQHEVSIHRRNGCLDRPKGG